jgi:hypothetical protein
MKLTEEQIKYMVNRFLCWRLPSTFNPDAGISYDKNYAERWGGPTGTNLLDAVQAEEMVRYMMSGMAQALFRPDIKKAAEDCEERRLD